MPWKMRPGWAEALPHCGRNQKQMEPVCLVTFMAKGFVLGQPICFQQDSPLSAAKELRARQGAGGRGVLVVVRA